MLLQMIVYLAASAPVQHQPVSVSIPPNVIPGSIIVLKTSDGILTQVQIPDDYTPNVPTPLNRGMIIPSVQPRHHATTDGVLIEQIHLHHTNTSTTSMTSVAISWATPVAAKCTPTLTWGAGTFKNHTSSQTSSGVTRSYTTAKLSDGKTAAEYQHVVVTGLVPRASYFYTVACTTPSTTGDAGQSFTFTAPRTTIDAAQSYSFAIFGDTGTSSAAHDTLVSVATHADDLDFVMQIGDISYGRGNEAIWNTFFDMIEPVASVLPWDVAPGNHDMRPGDSGGECGVPMLARFETPRSRLAFPEVKKLAPNGNDGGNCESFTAAADTNPYWYSVNVPHATVITYSTDSNYSKGSQQYEWLATELARANSPKVRAVYPWIFMCGHKPMYTAATYSGELPTRGNPNAGEGTEGSLTAELEGLFVDNKVDVSYYGHIHSYNRMYPVKNNGSWVDNSSFSVYEKPQAPVHMMIGMSGAGHLKSNSYDKTAWSAYSESSYGWVKGTFANASALQLQFIANGDGLMAHGTPSVHDEVWITK